MLMKILYVNFSGGKRNEKLILPINDSISVTLSSDQVCVIFSPLLKIFNNLKCQMKIGMYVAGVLRKTNKK